MRNRTFIPGSNWLFVKIYSGPNLLDKLLSNHISAFLADENVKDRISCCFFIRYNDPGNHIRIRLNLQDCRDIATVLLRLNKFLESFVENGSIYKVQLDTYKQEVERYGSNTIELTEQLFCIDSYAVIDILKHLHADESQTFNEDSRWHIGLMLIDGCFNAFSYDLDSKYKLISMMSESFKKEFGYYQVPLLSRRLSDKYRKNRFIIQEVFNKGMDDTISQIISQREQDISLLSQKIIAQLKIDIDQYLNSIIHMTMNRLFRTRNRECELVLYDFLERYYKSQISIRNKNSII